MMWVILFIPFFIQAVAIMVDEFYFHCKRGLPLWERIGHPIDTFSVIVCFAIVLFVPYSTNGLIAYVFCSVFSCLLVTKDEFVHKHHCPWSENWLHALLFILHPITLVLAGIMWPILQGVEGSGWLIAWMDDPQAMYVGLIIQAILMTFFFLYQVIFWNIIWKNSPVQKY